MKKLLLIVLASIFCGSILAQTNEPTPITYSAVVQVDGVDADELFARGRQWFAQSYNNSKVVLQMAENNRLVGKALLSFKYDAKVYSVFDCQVDYHILIECRDGRYKYTIDNLYLTVDASKPGVQRDYGLLTTLESLEPESSFKTGLSDKHRQAMWQHAKSVTDSYMKLLIASLQSAMSATITDNDW